MRKGSLPIFWIVTGLWAGASFLFLTQEAAATRFQMPDLKSQFSKQSFKSTSRVTLQADQVSFSTQDNKAYAKGNVVVNTKTQHLTCDQLQLDRVTQQVVAEGNVYLDTPQENVIARGLTYNFNDGTGEFRHARMYIDPYQVKGQKMDKISQDHMILKDGYLTSCDLDEPHYRVGVRRMDIYQKDRAIMRSMKIYIGKLPVMYLPYYVQDLKNRPILTFVPGHSKLFGMFLLTTAHFKVGSRVQLNVHGDYRERNGGGEGFDAKYSTPNYGSGLVSAYYTYENHIASHHLWTLYDSQGVKKGHTTHHELYRIVWRHHWQIDGNTNIVLQYYKIHDYDIVNNTFLKRYFPREYQQGAQNTNLNTYFLLTHNMMPHGTLTFNVDTTRENRPIRGLERIPEIQYTLNNLPIGKGFYAKSIDTFSDLTKQDYPKTFTQKTQRFDSNDDISRPFKLGFIEFNPHAGGEETFYRRTANISRGDVFRGMFRGELDMATHFYKVWDYKTNFAGLDINKLRHVITPTVKYLYQTRPTFPSSYLNQFDAIDSLSRVQQFTFGLENQLQTKRGSGVVDVIRFLVTSVYTLKYKGYTGHRGFGAYDTVLDMYPTNWLTIHNDNEYDSFKGILNSENTDVGIHVMGWNFYLGNRYTNSSGDQGTAECDYAINPKWRFTVFQTIPLINPPGGNSSSISVRQHTYVLTRDLHEWEMDISLNQQKGLGTTFYIVFHLKVSPGMKFNLVNTFFQRYKPPPPRGTDTTTGTPSGTP